jgi:hypothetical protein
LAADEVGFDSFTFKNLHAVLSQDLMRDPQASGRLRRRAVDISGTVFHPAALPQVIEDCFEQLLSKAAVIPDPFEQAFFLMVQLPYLQPFEDVNKRVSRVGANISLIKHNLCPLSFVDVPERAYVEGTLGVYELNEVDLLRDVFVWAYERSCQRYLHTLVPGLTGWAQVNGRDELPIPEKVKLDVAYLQRQSLWFDIRILWLTFVKVLRRDGVSH